MTAVNTAGHCPAIGLVATTNGILPMSPISGASRRPGVGLITAATEAVKSSAVNAIRREPGVGLISITGEIIEAPLAFGSLQAGRPAELGHSYLIDAAAVFLATTLLGGLGSLIWPDPTLLVAQSVLIGVLVLALAAGNGVALAFAHFGGADADTGALRSAAKYAAGFGLSLMSVFNIVGLVGSAVAPVYSGSILEALTVLSGMGVVLSASFLLVEWPRRIVGLEEGAFYSGVGGVFLVAGLLMKAAGIA